MKPFYKTLILVLAAGALGLLQSRRLASPDLATSDRISWVAGRALLLPLIVAGIASIAWWIRTEAAGHGDLRPYALVQFLPMLLLPLMLLLWKGEGITARWLWMALVTYAVAKLAEFGGLHAVKHLLAALAAWMIIRAFQRSPASAL